MWHRTSSNMTCVLCSIAEVTAVKLHAAVGHSGKVIAKVPKERMRLGRRTFTFLHQWCHSSFAVSTGEASGTLQRKQIRTRLYDLYHSMAKEELGVKPVSFSHFMKFMQDGYVDETLESCCCGGCVEGWLAIDMMKDFVLDTQYGFANRKELEKELERVHVFMKGDYRWQHLADSSTEAYHCINHALGCDCVALCVACDHGHVNTCLECNRWGGVVADVRKQVDETFRLKQQELLQEENIESKAEELNALLESQHQHINMIDQEFNRYRAHLVRKHKASAGQMEMMSLVDTDTIMLFMDYKQKVLPRKSKEGQSETFGKKGKSLCGLAFVFKVPSEFVGEIPKAIDREGDFAIMYIRIAADCSDQDFWQSVQTFEIGMRLFHEAFPWSRAALMYTDGAGTFRSFAFELMMAEVSAAWCGHSSTCPLAA